MIDAQKVEKLLNAGWTSKDCHEKWFPPGFTNFYTSLDGAWKTFVNEICMEEPAKTTELEALEREFMRRINEKPGSPLLTEVFNRLPSEVRERLLRGEWKTEK